MPLRRGDIGFEPHLPPSRYARERIKEDAAVGDARSRISLAGNRAARAGFAI